MSRSDEHGSSGADEQDDGGRGDGGYTRREVLGLIGGGAAAAVASGCLPSLPGTPGGASGSAPPPEVGSTVPLVLRRKDDFLRVAITWEGADLVDEGNRWVLRPRAFRLGAWGQSRIIFDFGPQHIAEEAFKQSGAVDPPPVGTRLAGHSRLAFELDEDVPFDLESLLDWAGLKPVLVPAAVAVGYRGGPQPVRAPESDETAIEVPWRLVLSPTPNERWVHERTPREVDGRHELWHTALTNPDGRPVVRAVWHRDSPGNRRLADDPSIGEGKPFEVMALGPGDRADIVTNSTAGAGIANVKWVPGSGPLGGSGSSTGVPGGTREGTGLLGGALSGLIGGVTGLLGQIVTGVPGIARGDTPPRAIDVDRLLLTSLGAWYELEGRWPGNTKNDLIGWQQRGTMGRDTFVRTDRKGWLFPYGHAAVKVTITERQFARASGGPRGAYLRQRTFLIITQRERRFAGGDAAGYAGEGRDLPFVAIECTARVTPDFDAKNVPPTPGNGTLVPFNLAQVPVIGETPMELGFVGIDWAGQRHPFTAPIVWLSDEIEPDQLAAVVAAYDAQTDSPGGGLLSQIAKRPMPGGEVAMTQPRDGDPGSSSFSLTTATFAVKQAGDVAATMAAGVAPFVPALKSATGLIPQAAGLGAAAESTFTYFAPYVDHGFDDLAAIADVNPGQVFAELRGEALEMAGEAATGILNGALGAAGLSRTVGALVGDLTDPLGGLQDLTEFAKGNFTPAGLLSAFKAKLFGVVAIKDLIPVGKLPSPEELAKELQPKAKDLTIVSKRTGSTVETHLSWTPELQQPEVDLVEIVTAEDVAQQTPLAKDFGLQPSRLTVDVRSTADLAPPTQSTYSVDAEVTNLRLNLLKPGIKFIVIDLRSVKFTAGSGRKPDVDVDVANVQFSEALEFVQDLAGHITGGGLGPKIDVDARGVTVAYAAPLPSIQIGVFALQNLSFSVGAFLPFQDEPLRLSASFSSRDNPFMLTIAMFGGGGWVSLVMGPDEVEELDIGLEFGANASLDIGVASGGVSLTAGIYLTDTQEADGSSSVALTGFLRLCGELEVLGIISISAEFFMSLTYLAGPKKAHGRAVLKVEVEVLFVSKSVELTVERYFSSSPNDPTFRDLMPPPPDGVISEAWSEYCDAFAVEAA